MLPPVMAWIAAFATGTAVLVAMTPRLPVYKLTVHQMPWLQRIDNQWKTKLPTRIEFHNENFVNIDVHAISFDLYYSTDAQKGHLQHIAHVHDKNQIQSTTSGSTTTSVPPTTNDKTQPVYNNNNNKISKRNNNNNKPPLWSIASRSYFVTHDDMYVKLFPKSTTTSTTSHPTDEIRTSSIDWKRVLASLRILLSHWWWNGNARHVIVPATGVAHIKAAAAVVTGSGTNNNNNNHHPSSTTSTTTTTGTPTTSSISTSSLMSYASPALTISMVCDNLIDTWTMQVQGVDCVLHQLLPGWVPWDQAVDKMRLYALTKLTANAETGGVLASTMKTSSSGTSSNDNDNTTPITATSTTTSSWKTLVNQLAWQEAMIAL